MSELMERLMYWRRRWAERETLLRRCRHDCRARGGTPWRKTLAAGALAFGLAGAVPDAVRAQHPSASAPLLVVDGVTVVDVERGVLIPNRRVVIAGNHIRTVGSARTVALPKRARVIPARGKYLIPGLWDMHISPSRANDLYYPRLLAYGVTGIRNAGAPVPLDTLRLWRQQILDGQRVGPTRQLIAPRLWEWENKRPPCFRNAPPEKPSDYIYICVEGPAHARRVVDSLQAAGADMITVTGASRETYFAMLAEARRVGLPFGGKDGGGDFIAESDSGARIVDDLPRELTAFCGDSSSASVERCRPVAERFRRNGTWVTVQDYVRSTSDHNSPTSRPKAVTSGGSMRIMQRVHLPLLAMSYVRGDYLWTENLPGSTLHETLADFVRRGLTPLSALQSATLAPAQMLHATDSLGTVAPGKLADLVLLDGNPLADITRTTAIRAVIANGQYFDRAALDRVLTEVEQSAKRRQGQ